MIVENKRIVRIESGATAPAGAIVVDMSSKTVMPGLIAAELLGISGETDTLDVGKSADLIAIDGDPLTDVGALMKIRYVMAAGRVVPMK